MCYLNSLNIVCRVPNNYKVELGCIKTTKSVSLMPYLALQMIISGEGALLKDPFTKLQRTTCPTM